MITLRRDDLTLTIATTPISYAKARSFSLESTLLAWAATDGSIAYAEDTHLYWKRSNGAWEALVTFAEVKTALSGADASVSVNTQKITSLGTPTAGTDAATKAYVDANGVALASTTPTSVGLLSSAVGVAATAARADHAHGVTDINLGGNGLYGSGTTDANGLLKYFPAQKAIALGMKADSPSTGRGVVIGMFDNSTGVDGNYNHLSGWQILEFGDVGLCGNSSNLANINTVDSANNDHTFMLGGGATLKRGFAFQFYNNGKFAGETYDLAASANEQGLAHFSTGVNQTGTASYALLRGMVHEGSVGSGFRRLLDLGINAGTSNYMVGNNVNDGTDAGGYTPQFIVETGGNVFHSSAAHEKWATTTNAGGTYDVGIKRSGSGTLTISNGSTGLGALATGDLTATGNASARAASGAAGSEQWGEGASATAANATALGHTASATASGAVAIGGSGVSSVVTDGIAIGTNATAATGNYAIAIGSGAKGWGLNSTGVGVSAFATAQSATAIGGGANASAIQAVALGSSSDAQGVNGVAIGHDSFVGASATGALALGRTSSVLGSDAIAIGNGATTGSGGTSSIAIGASANTSTFTNALAIGASATCTANNQAQLGTSSQPFNIQQWGSLSLASVSSGLYQYNTVDQTTNYERARFFWTSNIYVIQAQAGGGGTSRSIEMVTNDGSGFRASDFGVLDLLGSSAGYVSLVSGDTTGVSLNGRLTTANQANARLANSTFGTAYSSSNGLQQMLQVLGTINQSGTGAWTGIEVNATVGSAGSGAQLLYNGIVGGVSKFSVSAAGLVTATGAITTSGGNITTTAGQIAPNSNTANTPSGTTQTIDLNSGNFQTLSLASASGNVTLTLSNPLTGGSYAIKIIQHASSAKNVVWPVTVKWPGGTAPVISTGASAVDVVSLIWDGTSYYGSFIQAFA